MELHVAHFLLCRKIWYNNLKTEEGFSLFGVLSHFDAPEQVEYPLRYERLFVYLQLRGETGEYRFWIRLVRIDNHGYDGEIEVPLGTDGSHKDFDTPFRRPFESTWLNYVDELAFSLESIRINDPGLYEFQLFAEGMDEPIARERILARE
jgi:hypothetical protein